MQLTRIQMLVTLLPISFDFDAIKDVKIEHIAASSSENECVEIKLNSAIDPKTRKNINFSILVREPNDSTQPLDAYFVGHEVETHEPHLALNMPATNLLDDVRMVTAEIAMKVRNVAMCAQMVEATFAVK